MTAFFAAVCIMLIAQFYLMTHPAELLLAIAWVAIPIATWKLSKKFEEWMK